MLSDELSATMDDHAAMLSDGHVETGTDDATETTGLTKPPPEQRHQQPDPRHDSGWTSPQAPERLTDSMAQSGPRANSSPRASTSRSSAQHVERANRLSMSPHERPVSPGSTRTLSSPHSTPSQIALFAFQHLPVPLLVLSSLKTVVLANEAMGRLLGEIQQAADEEKTPTPEHLRGQSLSQLGVNAAQDGHSTSVDLEQYLDALISHVEHTEDARPDRSDVQQRLHDDGHGIPTVDPINTIAAEEVTQLSGQPTTVEVVISGKHADRLSSSEPRLKTTSPQRHARMTVTTLAPMNEETYFTLTFTDVGSGSSRTSQPRSNNPAVLTSNEVPIDAVSPSDATNVEQMISRMKEEDEERFKIMCDAMPQLVWMTTPDGHLEFYNQRWYEYTGLTEEASVGQGWMRAVHPEDVPKSDRLFQHSLKTGEPFVTEYRCRSKEGEWRWFITRALPFRSKETGEIERWFGTCTDANESIESRREVERTWQQLLTVISHAQVTVFQVDTQRRVTMLEGAMVEEALGGHDFGPRWYSGQDMYKVFGEVSRATDERQQRFLGPIGTILAGHPAEIFQEDEIDGRFYRTRFLPIGVKDKDGQIRATDIEGVIGVIRDVTELKSKEADIETQTREKQKLMASEAAAKEASKLKSQFLANMSHEIRTPITGVIGMAELLLDLDLGEEQREFTENIYRSANALLTVINDILDFSKVESGRLDVEEVQFSLSVIVQDVNKMLSFAAQRKNLDFSSDISDDVVNDLVVMGDPGRVRQIVTNLLTNSIKFTNQGHVKFTVLKEKETKDTIEIRFVIEDTGIGIEEEVRKRLFVPFSQGDASTARKFGGTGLGLTICKSLLDLMQGRIILESTVGSGTTATFWIPFKKPGSSGTNLVSIDPLSDRLQSDMSVSGNSSEPDGLLGSIPPELAGTVLLDGLKPSRAHRKTGSNITPTAPPSVDALSFEERSNLHILVVEDNAINQQIATKTIQKLGFDVSAAWNGKEALDYLTAAQEGKKRKPDVILMDVQMPVIDGYKCTHLLRYHLPYKTYVQDVPIVAMTASAIQGDREKCRKAGMDDYLAKPVRGKILERMLVRWTARNRPGVSRMSSQGSEISDVECSNASEHCDNMDIPCVEHDDDDFLDLRQTPLDDLRQHALDALLPTVVGNYHHRELSQPQQATSNNPSKPPLTRSDTEETQLARKSVGRNDSTHTAKRATSKTSNETDGEMAAQSRDAKLFGAAGAGREELPPQHVPSPSPSPSNAGGEALTEANMERHMQEEEFKLWHSND